MGMVVPPTYVPCPHCGERLHKSQLRVHLRDTGELMLRPVDACVVLFDLRNSHKEVIGA